jgi:hypothetical protein
MPSRSRCSMCSLMATNHRPRCRSLRRALQGLSAFRMPEILGARIVGIQDRNVSRTGMSVAR